MELTDKITVTNEENMGLMGRYPNNYFDLAIIDPPYGIGAGKPATKSAKTKQKNGSTLMAPIKSHTKKDWDRSPITSRELKETIRVSKNQIIWGVNYFSYDFPGGRIVWDKMNGETDQYGCEIAYNSFNTRTDIVHFMWRGMIQGANISENIRVAIPQQGNKKLNEKIIHPCQKPVKLCEWLLMKYATAGDKILDTHAGSLSLAIACDKLGFELTACELDKEYYSDSIKRFKQATSQQRLF